MSMRGRLQKYGAEHDIPSFFGQMSSTLRSGFCDLGHARWSFTDSRPWCRDQPQTAWISMVRDPWERMKSAFYYCEWQWQRAKVVCAGCAQDLHGHFGLLDPICNVGPLAGSTPAARACEFARRWGLNYQFEYYIHLDYEQIRALPCAPPDSECPAHKSPLNSRNHKEEVGMRDHSCLRRAIRACRFDSNQTAASKALIADAFRAQESLLAVGIVEEWAASLQLFERVTKCGGLASDAYVADELHESFKRTDPAAVASAESELETCRADVTTNYMDVDYALYAHARSLFREQRRGVRGQRSWPLGAPLTCTQSSAVDPVACA